MVTHGDLVNKWFSLDLELAVVAAIGHPKKTTIPGRTAPAKGA
jgi:hypothetical protein